MHRKFPVIKLLPILIAALLISCDNLQLDFSKTATGEGAEPQNLRPRVNLKSQMNKPTVVMISIDGFRADYLDRFKPPTLLSWAKNGIRANGLVPSFPTLTFPNHISLITGLRPGNHGIVGNKFYDEKRQQFYSMGDKWSVNDGSWYRGVPLWTAAEKQGMLSATCFWVGSEAKIGGIHPSYMKPYDGRVSNDQRVKWVTEWLTMPEHSRPHFISLYFSDVDSVGHKFGAHAPETKKAVLAIDATLSELKRFIELNKLDVQIVVVSDHGMKSIEKTVDLSSVVNSSLKGFQSSGRGATVSFYSEDSAAIENAYQDLQKVPGDFTVYRGNELPQRWKLNDKERRGDIVVVGKPGVYIGFQEGFATQQNVGSSNLATHGWDTAETTELNGLFIASGSRFKNALRVGAIDNVHVYPLVMDILGLKVTGPIDGDLAVLKPALRYRKNQ